MIYLDWDRAERMFRLRERGSIRLVPNLEIECPARAVGTGASGHIELDGVFIEDGPKVIKKGKDERSGKADEGEV